MAWRAGGTWDTPDYVARIARRKVSHGTVKKRSSALMTGELQNFEFGSSERSCCVDRYNIPSFLSIPEKVALSTKILFDGDELNSNPLNITYLSAASIPLALPQTVARGFGWPSWEWA